MEHRAQRIPEGHGHAARSQRVEQIARAGRGLTEPLGTRAERIPERMQQRDSPIESGERIPFIDLKRPRDRLRRHPRESTGVGAKRLPGVGRQCASGKQMQAGDAKALGSRELESSTGLSPPPSRPCACIEEYARDREVEPDARTLGAVDAFEQRCNPIDAARLEVPPPAVKWDIERRVVAPHLTGDIVGGAGKLPRVEHEMREGAALACIEQLVTALAYGLGTEKRRRRGVNPHFLPARGQGCAQAG